MPESETNTSLSPIEYFRIKAAETDSSKSQANLSQAIDALDRFTAGTPLTFSSFTPSLLGEWVSRLIFQGYTLKTAAYYLKKISSLYNKAAAEGLAPSTTAFSTLLSRLNTEIGAPTGIGGAPVPTIAPLSALLAFYSVPGSPANSLPAKANANAKQLAKDLLLLSIFLGGAPLTEIINFRKDSYTGSDPAILQLIARYSKPKNKYLFPLHQSERTPAQLLRTVEALILSILPPGSDISSPTTLWSAVALHCGFSASEIAACLTPEQAAASPLTAFTIPLGSEAPSPPLAPSPGPEAPQGSEAPPPPQTRLLCSSVRCSGTEARREEIRRQINETLTANPIRWYAMQFRRRVTFDMIRERMEKEGLTPEEIYYPHETIVRKIGRRKVSEERPVISGLLFFRYRVTDLNRLFLTIGDLAWGYRYRRDFRSPYAAISADEILRYQTALGTFSEDAELLPAGTIPLREGDRLIIIGGLLSGQPATFAGTAYSRKPGEKGRTVYRLLLPGDNKCEWAVETDPRLVRPLSESEFQELGKKNQKRGIRKEESEKRN